MSTKDIDNIEDELKKLSSEAPKKTAAKKAATKKLDDVLEDDGSKVTTKEDTIEVSDVTVVDPPAPVDDVPATVPTDTPFTKEDNSESTGVIKTLHFVESGLTVLGRVRKAGEEFSVEVGSGLWKRTLNRLGESWVDLADNESRQKKIYGRVMFKPGPVPTDE